MVNGSTIQSKNKSDYKIVGINLAVILTVLAATFFVPRDGRALVMVSPSAPPGRIMETIASAGGTYLAATRFDNMAIAHFDKPNFVIRLFSAGAVLVMDGNLASACISENST